MERPTARIAILALLLTAATAAGTACGGGGTNCSSKFSPQPRLSEIQREIFNRSCAFSSCHGDSDTQPKAGGMNLSEGKAYLSLLNIATGKPAAKRVEPGKPERSFLIEKLTSDTPTDEGTRMPKDMEPLCGAEVDTIRTWIALGAKND